MRQEIPQRPPRQKEQNIVGFAFNRAGKDNVFAHHISAQAHDKKQAAIVKQTVKHGLAQRLRRGRNGGKPPHHTGDNIDKEGQIKKGFGEINILGAQELDRQGGVNEGNQYIQKYILHKKRIGG